MLYPQSAKILTDKAVKLKLEDVLDYAKSIMDENDDLFEKAAEYLCERYPRGCEVLYATGKIFVGGSVRDIATALLWMKHTLDAGFQKGVSKNEKVRLRYTEEELLYLKTAKTKKPKKARYTTHRTTVKETTVDHAAELAFRTEAEDRVRRAFANIDGQFDSPIYEHLILSVQRLVKKALASGTPGVADGVASRTPAVADGIEKPKKGGS